MMLLWGDNMIRAKEVSLRYPEGTLALKGIELNIGKGELVYVTGPSGSGKTSFLKILMGMEYPTSGSLRVLGQPIVRGKENSIRGLRRNIGPVFQEFKLIEGRTALENVIMGVRFLEIPYKQMKQSAVDVLKKLGLEHKMLTKVENLSWGQAQRVAIARAVARQPALILADEPTGNLDYDNALAILNLLTSFRDVNRTIIITTHATHLIEDYKNATHIRMEDGSMSIERWGKNDEKCLV